MVSGTQGRTPSLGAKVGLLEHPRNVMSLSPGSRLGAYEVLSLLGAGGMGEVYKAKDTRLDRTVAVKVLPGHLSADPERRARFAREARTIAGLGHPHICALYDVGREGDVDFLVMDTSMARSSPRPVPSRRGSSTPSRSPMRCAPRTRKA